MTFASPPISSLQLGQAQNHDETSSFGRVKSPRRSFTYAHTSASSGHPYGHNRSQQRHDGQSASAGPGTSTSTSTSTVVRHQQQHLDHYQQSQNALSPRLIPSSHTGSFTSQPPPTLSTSLTRSPPVAYPITPRRLLNYPLPLSTDQHLAAVALMQERQESWTRVAHAAASSSSASSASSPGSASPIQSVHAYGGSERAGAWTGGSGGGNGGPSRSGSGSGSGGGSGKTKGGKSGKPRKKVAKACLACQKSHLTCDEQRPCTRCVKKGIGDACVEGVRKKAKYLLEGDERGHNPSASGQPSTYDHPTTSHHSKSHSHSPTQPQPQPHPTQHGQGAPSLVASSSNPSIGGLPNLPPDLASRDSNQNQNQMPMQAPNDLGLAQMGQIGSMGLGSTDNQAQNLQQDQQPQRTTDDVWLSAPAPLTDNLSGFGGLQGMQGMQGMQDLNMGMGMQGGNELGGGIDTRRLWGDSGNDGDLFCPTAAADEFHMLDSMFGNMSPVNFPFSDSTPTAEDPFGLGLNSTGNGNGNGQGDMGWDSFGMDGGQQVQALGQSRGQNGQNGGNGQGGQNGQNGGNGQNGQNAQNLGVGPAGNGFDLNSAWAAWTASGHQTTNPSELGNMVNASPNTGHAGNLPPQSQNQPTGLHSLPHVGSDSNIPLLGQNNGDSNSTNNGRSASAPSGPGSISTPLGGVGGTRMLPTNSSGGGGGQGGNAEIPPSQPIGEGPFGLSTGGTGREGYRNGRVSASEVYRTVNKPFDYTEGYHVLMQYLSNNFDQRDALKVVHALAAYRPSLIALQMPMSEEDEVFLERSFQRTLIELEKLISYSATPTAVWRRTGEVCYANPEFCRLVGRSEAELCAKKSYVYQIFAKQSVIGYWENFSVHAFENTTQNFFQTTTLERGRPAGGMGAGQAGFEGPSGGDTPVETVQCSACFTIRRDVFDLPSVIIGQFLPIPTDLL